MAGADADLAALARIATAPAAAATPGGSIRTLSPRPIPGSGTQPTVTASSCATQAGQLRRREITSYRCATATPRATTTGRLSAAKAPAWPKECSAMNGAGSGGWIAISRRGACTHHAFEITVYEYTPNQPPKVVGTAILHAVDTMIASKTKASWSHTKYMWVWSATGRGRPTSATGAVFGSCPGCLGKMTNWGPAGSLGDAWRGAGEVETNLGINKVVTMDGFWEVTLSGTGWGNSVLWKSPVGRSRCDNTIVIAKRRVPGCVFNTVPSVVGFSETVVPQFVKHVSGAQASGLPGKVATATFLTRLTDTKLKDKNGATACPPGLKRPKNHQCDEYPFRSTYQGAATGGGAPRSQPWCAMKDPARKGAKGWSRCFIDSTQNMSAGGSLGAFYRNERMLVRDPFQVGFLK